MQTLWRSPALSGALASALLLLFPPLSRAQSPAPPSFPPILSSSPVLERRMDAWMDAYARRNLFSGTVLVAKDGKPILRRAYGCADYSLKPPPPNTPETRMYLFSMTKQFTAACILLLQERGELNVNNSVGDYLPNWPVAWSKVTVHHLLTHTSGLKAVEMVAWWNAHKKTPSVTPTERPAAIPAFHLKAQPGTKFEYSNIGYMLLAGIVSKVSGQSYRDFLKANGFEPLGMTHADAYQPGVKEERAHGHLLTGGRPLPEEQTIDGLIGAGDICTNVDDLLKWDQALRQPGFLTASSLHAMFRDWGHGYGYGWFIANLDGHLYLHHGGGGSGFESMIARLPREGLTVIVLSNLSGYVYFRTFADLLAQTALGGNTSMPDFPQLSARQLDRFTGDYKLDSANVPLPGGKGQRLHITRSHQTAALDLGLSGEGVTYTAHAISNTTFDSGVMVAIFLRDGREHVTGAMLMLQGIAMLKFKKLH